MHWHFNLSDIEQKHKYNAPPKLHTRGIFGRIEVEFPQVLLFDIVQDVLMNSKGRSLALQLEDDHAAVVSWEKG